MTQNDYYNVSKILEEMELELFKNYKKAMAKDIDKPAKQWRELQILNLQQFQKENRQIVEYYNKLLRKEVEKSLKQSYKEGIIQVLKEEERTEQYFLDKIDYNKINSLMNSVFHDFEKASWAAMRQVNDIYRQNIFKTMMYYDTGTISLKKAVDMSSKSFIQKGLNSIIYGNGNKVDICAYSDMVLRTNSHRVKVQGEAVQASEFGIVTCYVSKHGSTCKKCAVFEGLFLLDDVNNVLTQEQQQKYGHLTKLSEAIDHGLFHPNCRHSLIYQRPDNYKNMNKKANYDIEDDEEKQRKIDRYNREQLQRGLEREIRKAKREAVTSVDPQNRKKAQEKVKMAQSNMRVFLKQNPDLVRRYDRENTVLTRGY